MTEVNFRIVIPARFASSRFPGKVLAPLAGRPLIRHVYERATRSLAAEVVVATDDRRIADVARTIGASVEMTSDAHCSGTDRIAEVAARRGWADGDIIVNVQGDAPLIAPSAIDQVAGLLTAYPGAGIGTLCVPLESESAYRDPNVVKVVFDSGGRALYFSRASIPAPAHGNISDDAVEHAFRHIGLYAYRVDALYRLQQSPPCYLEVIEKLEQLRALWLGIEIRVGIAEQEQGPDVDTPEDLEAAERFIAGEDEGGKTA